jgi:hypothetical protein
LYISKAVEIFLRLGVLSAVFVAINVPWVSYAMSTGEYLPTFRRSGEFLDPEQTRVSFLQDVDEHLPVHTVYSTIKCEYSNK